MVEVEADKEPSEGEVLIFTLGGTFIVKGEMTDIAERVAAEDWPSFELAERGERVTIRSSQIVALREGTRPARRGHIGFGPR